MALADDDHKVRKAILAGYPLKPIAVPEVKVSRVGIPIDVKLKLPWYFVVVVVIGVKEVRRTCVVDSQDHIAA